MNKDVSYSLAWASVIVGLALAASFARSQGYIDQDMTIRIVLGATGLMIAAYGNRLPKTFVAGAHARRAQRVAAWSMAISGLIYAAAFIFAPVMTAVVVGCGAVIVGLAVTLGYCLMLRNRPSAA